MSGRALGAERRRHWRTPPAENGRNPDWSPDGSKLAYDDGEDAVMVSDATGANARTVIRGAAPAWSSDGSLLAFARGQKIFLAAADEQGFSRVVVRRSAGAAGADRRPRAGTCAGWKVAFSAVSNDGPSGG